MTGAEALARGAAEDGVQLVAGCPVSTIGALLDAAEREAVLAERTPTDKVALEVAMGACLAGARAVAALPGLAAGVEPLRAMTYVGAAGLVIVAIDDPALARSCVETDSRMLARALELPCVEPSDARECKEHLAAALELSELWDTPVVLRLTARTALGGRPVPIGTVTAARAAGLRRGRERPVLSLEQGPRLRLRVEERLAQLAAHGVDSPLNRVELRSAELGVITSGAAYHHVREALPDASVLKLGLSFPLPTELVRDFAGRVEKVVVIEELEPVIESELRALGIACRGKDLLPRTGELGPDLLSRALGGGPPATRRDDVPPRPPEACAGCPQRAVLQALKRVHVSVAGELGCSALGAEAPLRAVDRAVGASSAVALARGAEAVLGERVRGRQVALMGEGALVRGGAPALAHAAASAGGGTIVVVADGASATCARTPVDVAALARALGAPRVREVDALDLAAMERALRDELAAPELSVIVARGRCPVAEPEARAPSAVRASRCNRCGACLRLGCPALSEGEEAMEIDAGLCAGCGLCAQVCRSGAISRAQELP